MENNKITVNNLLYAIIFLIFGIFLLTSSEDIITIISKFIGIVLIIIGVIKSIIYVYMKGKLGNYSIGNLSIGLLVITFGLLLIFYSNTFSVALRTIIGFWIIFSGINKVIFSLSYNNGFLVYLITSLLMIILGILIITGIFDQLIGLLIIIYSIIEIVDYIYFKVNKKDNLEETKVVKKSKYKKGKVVDAIIEDK